MGPTYGTASAPPPWPGSPRCRPRVNRTWYPSSSPLRGDLLWTAVDAKPKTSVKLRRLRNIRSNPRVSLLVDHYDSDWSALWWVRADGTAEVVDSDTDEGRRGLRLLVAKYTQYQSDPPAGPVIVVRVDAWRYWSGRS